MSIVNRFRINDRRSKFDRRNKTAVIRASNINETNNSTFQGCGGLIAGPGTGNNVASSDTPKRGGIIDSMVVKSFPFRIGLVENRSMATRMAIC